MADTLIEVHWATVDGGDGAGLTDDVRAGLTRDVDPGTLARLARMRRDADRDRGLAAHALLRRLLGARLGLAAAEVPVGRACVTCGSVEHGKPHVRWGDVPAPVEFNLTHAGRVVAVVLAPAGMPVGVDVEVRRPIEWPAMRRRVFGDEEWDRTERAEDPDGARFAAWSRKEAALKVSGHGLALSLSGVRVVPGTAGEWSAVLPDPAPRVIGQDLGTVPGHVGAVAWPAGGGVPKRWTEGPSAGSSEGSTSPRIEVHQVPLDKLTAQ